MHSDSGKASPGWRRPSAVEPTQRGLLRAAHHSVLVHLAPAVPSSSSPSSSLLLPRRPAARGPRRGATAQRQRDTEPAWHRRRRRQRASARVLLRVASAARTLQAHHSAQRHGRASGQMPGQRRGADAGGGPSFAARVAELERAASAWRQQGQPGTSSMSATPCNPTWRPNDGQADCRGSEMKRARNSRR